MDSWKTLSLSIYKDYIMSTNDKEVINYEKNSNILYNLVINMKKLVIASDNVDIHRNTTKTNSLILLNQVYINALNNLTQYYFNIKQTNEYK